MEGATYRKLCQLGTLVFSFIAVCADMQFTCASVYLIDIKAHFEWGQLQVDLAMGLSSLGFALIFPAGVLALKCGLVWTSVIAFLLPSISYALLWSATRNAKYYMQHQGLVFFYFFLIGCAGGYGFIVWVTAAVRHINSHWHGRYFGWMLLAPSVGQILFSLIFLNYYRVTHDEPKGNPSENISGYFLFVTVFVACSGCVAMLFTILASHSLQYSRLSEEGQSCLPDEENKPTSPRMERHSVQLKEVEGEISRRLDERTTRQLLSSARLHLLVWPCGIILGLRSSLCGNLYMYLNAFNMTQYLTSLPYLSPTFSLLSRPIIGWVSDRAINRFPRVGYITLAIIAHMSALLLALVIFDFLAIMITCLLVWTLATDLVETNGPALLLDEFGVAPFTACMGLIYAVSSLVTLASQVWIGMIYEMLGDVLQHDCLGLTCFTWNFSLCIFVVLIALILIIIYLRITRTDRSHLKYKFCAGE